SLLLAFQVFQVFVLRCLLHMGSSLAIEIHLCSFLLLFLVSDFYSSNSLFCFLPCLYFLLLFSVILFCSIFFLFLSPNVFFFRLRLLLYLYTFSLSFCLLVFSFLPFAMFAFCSLLHVLLSLLCMFCIPRTLRFHCTKLSS